MWKKVIKTGWLGIGFCCLGLLTGSGAQAASVLDDTERAVNAQQHYAQMMNNQKTGLEKTDPELDSMMKKIYMATSPVKLVSAGVINI